MNAVFVIILLSSIGVLIFSEPDLILASLLTGGNNGLQFAFKLFIIYSVWLTVLTVLEKSKIDKVIAKGIRKYIKKLFKGENDAAYMYLSLNLSCNFLGMGGAGTPLGIKAVETMQNQKNKIMLVVINSTSIQLIPTTIVAMRASLGSRIDIIIPSFIATLVTTLIGVLLVMTFVKER